MLYASPGDQIFSSAMLALVLLDSAGRQDNHFCFFPSSTPFIKIVEVAKAITFPASKVTFLVNLTCRLWCWSSNITISGASTIFTTLSVCLLNSPIFLPFYFPVHPATNYHAKFFLGNFEATGALKHFGSWIEGMSQVFTTMGTLIKF